MPNRLPSIAEIGGDRRKKTSRGPSVLRDINSRAVLQLLRLHHPCSCSDLARYSGLSVPTVVSSVTRLERMGLVKRLGKGSSSGGRPPDMLSFNESYGYVAGIDLSEGLIRVGLADLSGRILGESSGEIAEKSWPMAVVDQMVSLLTALRESSRIPAKRLLGVGVSAPGITDVDAGLVVSVPSMPGWENVPLGPMLSEKIRVPAVVENDVNVAALGEHSYGVAQGERNFVFIHIGRGVGAGLFINGQLHHGPEWTAGEIGYLLLPGTAVQAVRKSQVGALEAAIGIGGIERQWRELLSPGANGARSLRSTEILDRALKGDPAAQRIVDRVAEYLAMVCSYLSLILNCSLIVFGGEVGMHPALLQAVSARLADHDFAHPRLAITQLGSQVEMRGALCLALQAAEAVLP
jgi:glucokinase